MRRASTIACCWAARAILGTAALGLVPAAHAAAASALIAPLPAPPSKFLPPLETMALSKERQVLDRLLVKMAGVEDAKSQLTALDAALAQLPEPTKLRGFVQLSRAAAFQDLEDFPKAVEAIEESVRLLEGYSAPLIQAALLYAYGNQPAKGADYLLRAATLDPATVRTIDDYEISNFFSRLHYARDERRAFALGDRLLAIDWIGTGLGSQSGLARLAIERRVRDGDLTGARALVPKLLVPGHSYSLLSSRAYSPLWEGIERWAGSRLERQWALYLNEARARWNASKAVDTVLDYSGALSAAGHYDTIIRDILPLYSGDIDQDADVDLIFALTTVADALARKGRWQDIEALYARAEKIWPLTWNANAVNVTANRGRYLLLAGRPADALRYLDLSLAEGLRWQVNHSAIATMHHYRACTLHELGRTTEAGVSLVQALAGRNTVDAAGTHLCMGNEKAARQALLEGLKNPIDRDGAIAFFQEPGPEPPSDYVRQLRLRTDALMSDPVLRTEMLKHGRILPFRANAGAPPEQPAHPPAPPSDAPAVSELSPSRAAPPGLGLPMKEMSQDRSRPVTATAV